MLVLQWDPWGCFRVVVDGMVVVVVAALLAAAEAVGSLVVGAVVVVGVMVAAVASAFGRAMPCRPIALCCCCCGLFSPAPAPGHCPWSL